MVLELSASIPALYGERPFAAACKAAAADGFGSVEMWAAPDPSEWADAVRALTAGELSLTSVNSDAGDGPAFGTAADPTTTVAWRAGFRDVLEFARRSGASAINVLAGARLA